MLHDEPESHIVHRGLQTTLSLLLQLAPEFDLAATTNRPTAAVIFGNTLPRDARYQSAATDLWGAYDENLLGAIPIPYRPHMRVRGDENRKESARGLS